VAGTRDRNPFDEEEEQPGPEDVMDAFVTAVHTNFAEFASALSNAELRGRVLTVRCINKESLDRKWCVMLATNAVATRLLEAAEEDPDAPGSSLITLN